MADTSPIDSVAAAGTQEPGLGRPVPAPVLPYKPCDPQAYQPLIGLVGCGGISKEHLRAYRRAGYRVAALCDVVPHRARKRKTEFYPEARVYRDYRDLLRRDDIEVVDLATHPAERAEVIEAAIAAGKHVLSQKPFVIDLDRGRRLVELAERRGVKLAVNQNARYAPHFRYIIEAVRAGLIGEVTAVEFSVHWNHDWVRGTPFDRLRHLILWDFGIHWFDLVCCLLAPRRAERVYASVVRSPQQSARPPLLAQALIEYPGAQVVLVFNGAVRYGPQGYTRVSGTKGTLVSTGADYRQQQVTLITEAGWARPELEGCWFPDGFHGTMGELLCAVEQQREPSIAARENLQSLALCFAAAASADRHEPVVPGTVRQMPE